MVTDNELIQALRICTQQEISCNRCPLVGNSNCVIFSAAYAADRLEDLLEEITDLSTKNKKLQKRIYDFEHENEVLRSQTVTLRAEQLPECLRPSPIGADAHPEK